MHRTIDTMERCALRNTRLSAIEDTRESGALRNNLMNHHTSQDNITKYFNGIDIIYWINLNRSVDRKENMIKMLNEFPVKNIRIEAVDGKNESDNNIYGRYENVNMKNTKIEYACLLSHLNTIHKFSNSSYNIALILEDDVNLEFVKYWNKSIKDIINNAPTDWDIIMLNYIISANTEITNEYTLNHGMIYSTASYIINKKGANKLLNIYKNNKYNLDIKKRHTADEYLFSSLITYVYKYPYFTYPNDNTSTIHNDHMSVHMNSKNYTIKLWDELTNKIEDFKEDFKEDNSEDNTINLIDKSYIIILIIIIIIILIIILIAYKKYIK